MVVVSVKQPRWVETQLKSPAKGKVVLWRLGWVRKMISVAHNKPWREGLGRAMDGRWLDCYGMHGWEETLDKAVPIYLQIPADPSVMIIESRQPVLG